MHTWTGAGNGTTWDDGANWDLGTVPGSSDDVLIGNSYSVLLGPSGSGLCQNLELGSAASLVISDNSILDVNGNSYISQGTLTVEVGSQLILRQNIELNGVVVVTSSSLIDGTGIALGLNGTVTVQDSASIASTIMLDILPGRNVLFDGGNFTGEFVNGEIRGNLTVQSGAVVRPSSTYATVSGQLIMSGIYDPATNFAVLAGGYMSVGSSAQLDASVTVASGGTLVVPGGALTGGMTLQAGALAFTASINAVINGVVTILTSAPTLFNTGCSVGASLNAQGGAVNFVGASLTGSASVSNSASLNFSAGASNSGSISLVGSQVVTFNSSVNTGAITFSSANSTAVVVSFANGSRNAGGALIAGASAGIVSYDHSSLLLTLRSNNPTQLNIRYPVGLSGATIGL